MPLIAVLCSLNDLICLGSGHTTSFRCYSLFSCVHNYIRMRHLDSHTNTSIIVLRLCVCFNSNCVAFYSHRPCKFSRLECFMYNPVRTEYEPAVFNRTVKTANHEKRVSQFKVWISTNFVNDLQIILRSKRDFDFGLFLFEIHFGRIYQVNPVKKR